MASGAVVRPSALIERYRFALEVIAQGPEWDPATKTARMALLPPEVWAEVRVVAEDVEPGSPQWWARSRVCDDGLHTACLLPGCTCECHREVVESTNPEAGPLWRVTQTITPVEPDAPSEPAPDLEREPTPQPELDDDEPVGVDLAELEREVDAEIAAEAAAKVAEVEASPQRRTVEKAGQDGLTDTQRAILAYIRERGEVSRSMIMRDVDTATSDRTKRALNVLCHRGLIVGEGATSTRTYKPVVEHSEHREATEAGQRMATEVERERIDAVKAKAATKVSQDKPTMPASKPVPSQEEGAAGYDTQGLVKEQKEAKRNGGGADEGRLLEAVKFRPKWTIEQHATRLDMPQDRVAMALRKLEEEGEVQTFARGGRVAWVLR